MLAFEAPVSAVSLAAKKAETNRQAITMEKVIQSNLGHPKQSSAFRQFGFQKIANQ
jgi:hypothetical protein